MNAASMMTFKKPLHSGVRTEPEAISLWKSFIKEGKVIIDGVNGYGEDQYRFKT